LLLREEILKDRHPPDERGVIPAEREGGLHLVVQLVDVVAQGAEMVLVSAEMIFVSAESRVEVMESLFQSLENRAEQPVEEASGRDHRATESPQILAVDVIEPELMHDLDSFRLVIADPRHRRSPGTPILPPYISDRFARYFGTLGQLAPSVAEARNDMVGLTRVNDSEGKTGKMAQLGNNRAKVVN
jgi:hypothetical protein